MIQDKAQPEENDAEPSFEGRSASRAVTLYWIIWVTAFGRVGKRSPALLGCGKELSLPTLTYEPRLVVNRLVVRGTPQI